MDWKATLKIRAWATANVPMIGYTRPKVIKSGTEEVEIQLPLRRRNKNHWGTMYFGALAVGADLAAGLMAMNCIEKSGEKVSLVFSDFQATFHRRPDGAVRFQCSEGPQIAAQVQEAIASKSRVTKPIQVQAFVGEELVASMQLGLSLKPRH